MQVEEIEEWRPVKGHQGIFVSNMGRVKRTWTDKRHPFAKIGILTPFKSGDYLACTYGHIHRLVAEAFVPNTDKLPCVNHINEDKMDNRQCNLEWVTHKENSNWGTCQDRIKATKEERAESISESNRIGALRRVGKNHTMWYKKFCGMSVEQITDEIERSFANGDITAQMKYQLLEKYVRHPYSRTSKEICPPRKTRNWKNELEGMTKDEMENYIDSQDISSCQKCHLKQKYIGDDYRRCDVGSDEWKRRWIEGTKSPEWNQ